MTADFINSVYPDDEYYQDGSALALLFSGSAAALVDPYWVEPEKPRQPNEFIQAINELQRHDRLVKAEQENRKREATRKVTSEIREANLAHRANAVAHRRVPATVQSS